MSEEMTNLPANPEEPDLDVVSDNTRYVHTFAEPFKWGGTEYEKLTFNFGAMKGKDVIAITQELRGLPVPLCRPVLRGEDSARSASEPAREGLRCYL